MSCAGTSCHQGRQKCATPWECGLSMHRITSITPPAALEQRDGGASVDTEPTPDAWAWIDGVLDSCYFWAPFIGVALGLAIAWALAC